MNISCLGLNKGKIKQFNSKGIETIEDLINFLPKGHYDFRKQYKVREIREEGFFSVVGKIVEIREGEKYIRAKIVDSNNDPLYIVWFNQNFVKKKIQEGDVYNFCGKVEENTMFRSKQMINPLFFSKDLEEYKRIIPIYPKIKGMSSDYLEKSIKNAIQLRSKEEIYEEELLKKYSLITREECIEGIHCPEDFERTKKAQERLLFDDLFYFALSLSLKQKNFKSKVDIDVETADTIKPFIDSLPFELTEDQLNITRSVFSKMKKNEKVNALVQGDVGSGKTMVAFILMLIMAENEKQSALMCPTNVLARQHYEEMEEIAKKMGYKVAFLSGETKAKEKRAILKELKEGDIKMVVGTHAIISKGVEFKNLGLSIVDEEHRFGVIQKKEIEERNNEIHSITMSATPIPRSLALTVYGENIDIYSIKKMPKGRKPVETKITKSLESAYPFMEKEIKKGRQCYIVCPLIEESESEKMKDVLSVTQVYEKTKKYYRNKGIKIALINGSMKQDEISKNIELFQKGEYDILISTTIVEVGVNVPNSTLMVIQNAERFGLAQLHQLRGRVGRGSHQSYCLLVSDKTDNEKLIAMEETTNGFKIAEYDLKIRGYGDFLGTKQSGDNKYVMLMISNQDLFGKIRGEIKKIKELDKYIQYFGLTEKDPT